MVLDIGMLEKVEEVKIHQEEERFVIEMMVVHIIKDGLVHILKEEVYNVTQILA